MSKMTFSEFGLSIRGCTQLFIPSMRLARAFLLLLWPQIEIDYAGTNVCQPQTHNPGRWQANPNVTSSRKPHSQLTGADTTSEKFTTVHSTYSSSATTVVDQYGLLIDAQAQDDLPFKAGSW